VGVSDFTTLRHRLLELHKCLLDAERATYEAQHGRVSANAFLQALTSDPALTWLAPLNTAIVRLDELLDLADDTSAGDHAMALNEHLVALRALLTLDSRVDPFAARYRALIDANADVAFAHGALWSVLRA
jgi:hypothetical protein